MSTAGFSEGTDGAAGLGLLILKSNATLDFGSSSGSVLAFAGVGTHTGGTLTVTNWGGAGEDDRLIFTGSAQDFASAFAPTDVSFDGVPGYAAIQFDDQHYEIVAVPEPASTALIGSALLLGFIGFRERRRVARLGVNWNGSAVQSSATGLRAVSPGLAAS